ncbi:MAG: zinc metallopeptidase [Bacteroidota bacterium]|jgi:Zn-dependent membrane protease YugP|nr:zinc metallopeptidase [Cytophagales bacterium]MCE2958053.1 zinc metallopeptidase [Flammeovirgaceae bacterium]MCZ8068854.1 zinc metallopeptidase [Cytophagales bacterium]
MGFGALFIGLFFMAIGWMVSSRLKSKFKEYSQTHLTKDLTGAEIARLMLADNGINDVKVISVEGQLTDHYNPADKTVNLSQEVFYGRNAAATAVAAHECGHAVQHAKAYSMLQFRSAMVPIQNVSAQILNFLTMAMMFGAFFASSIMPWQTAILLIIACYSVFALFALITLPVEFDASKRALAWVEARGIVTRQEHDMAKDALKWAAMTYVVAAIGAVTTLVYYIMMYLGADRD